MMMAAQPHEVRAWVVLDDGACEVESAHAIKPSKPKALAYARSLLEEGAGSYPPEEILVNVSPAEDDEVNCEDGSCELKRHKQTESGVACGTGYWRDRVRTWKDVTCKRCLAKRN